MLYVCLKKALYGCLRAALIFYRKLRKEMTDYGLVTNNNNPCTTNKIVEGIPMTVTWYIDDPHISHKNHNRVTDLLTHLEKLYGEKFPVS